MMEEMSGEPGAVDRLRSAMNTEKGQDAVAFLIFVKSSLGTAAYKELVKAAGDIVEQSSKSEGGITVQKCEERLSKVFAGQTCVLEGFHDFLGAHHPSQDVRPSRLELALSFLNDMKNDQSISGKDYNDLKLTLCQSVDNRNIKVEYIDQKFQRVLRDSPDLMKTFETFLPPGLREHLSNEQSCTSPDTSHIDKEVSCVTPDANHSFDGDPMKTISVKYDASQPGYTHGQENEAKATEHAQWIHDSLQTPTRGNGDSLLAEENEGDKTDPLPDWSPSRENELPPKEHLHMFKRCTTSYYLLPNNCLTLKASYRTELGQCVLNETLVSSTSGSEDCFKFRTKNHYEENIFKCEDDMFEIDMLLERYKATAAFIQAFIQNLQKQYHVHNDMEIQEHLTPLHRRCIEQLYDEHGLDMLDALSEKSATKIVLDILCSRLTQKIEDLSEAQLSLNKRCSNIIANNYHRSLDHRSSSFKQLDKRRMSPKALLAEAREINMTRLNGNKHLSSAWNNQSSLIPEDVSKDIYLHIDKDIDSMVRYASKSCPSEQKLMMIWTTLVQPFVSIISTSCQSQESNGAVDPKEACEHCGLSKTFVRSICDSSLANIFSLSSKKGGYLLNTSNNSASDACQTEIEDGEFIPDVNFQFGSMPGHGNGAACSDVAAPSGDGSSFQCPGHSICDYSNKSGMHHESREVYNVEMGSSAYSKRAAEPYNVKGSIPCCSLVVLLRLYQILYERLALAKFLSTKARDKASNRDSHTCDLYEGFKEELFNLLTGSSNSCSFEKYCLTILGPRSYVLFTLNEVIGRVVKQLCKICLVAKDDSILETHDDEQVRGPGVVKDLSCHKNSPGHPTNGSLDEQDHQEGEKGSKHNDDIVKPMQNHFERRKKRKLENS